MFTRKELRTIVVVAFLTVSTLVVLEKLSVSHQLSNKSHVVDVLKSSPTRSSSADQPNSVIEVAPDKRIVTVQSPLVVADQMSQPAALIVQPPLEVTREHVAAITTASKTSPDMNLFKDMRKCPIDVEQNYSTASSSNWQHDLKWCNNKMDTHHVSIGRSWGSLSRADKQQWDLLKCNELMSVGKLQSCDQRWGWGSFSEWLSRAVPVVQGVSRVTCARDIKTSIYCQYNDVIMDFSRMYTATSSRSFDEGFITAHGEGMNFAHVPRVPGFLITDVNIKAGADAAKVKAGLQDMHSKCDIIETRPTFVLSNDDIYNLGHYYNDVMGIWGMLTLANVNSKDALLINMDGWRAGGPAGMGSHRIMVPGHPDEHGPYINYFKSWFNNVAKARDYGRKKVCFKQLYLPPMPGIPWFWNDWGQVNDCSTQAASPLYQSYNLFMRQHWVHSYGALPNPPTDVVHIVIEVRAINPAKRNNHSSSRHIRNLQQLVAALNTIPGVRVTAQDFARIPFEEQVKLSHSAGVFVSMHGAGTTHIFHSALGQPNCCALVELFPDPTIDLHTAHGYGNLARMLGMHHYRHVSEHGTTSATGTEVNVAMLREIVEKAVNAVRTTPTCLHNVKDTTAPIYGNGTALSK